jgi:molecular chaperone GrpE
MEKEKEMIQEEVESVEETEETETEEQVSEVELLQNEVNSLKDKFLRNQAELENFKRRTQEERMKERKYAQQYILMKLIDLNDNFGRALQSNEGDYDGLKEGLTLIMSQLNSILEEENVKKIESVGKEFDPNFHQAVMTSNEEDLEDDIVAEEFQIGYMYKDRVLRPSMVKVNKKGE